MPSSQGQKAMPSEFVNVTCPYCFQRFAVAAPPPSELPAELDYDCEICCRPMVISCHVEGGRIRGEARAINE
jgi:Cysteine-rich CPXCG